MQQTIFKNHYEPIGQLGYNQDLEKKTYKTTRDSTKGQIYMIKESFIGIDGKMYTGKNCIGISEHIVKQLQFEGVGLIIFTLKNFPIRFTHCIGKIRLKDFLEKSRVIQEKNYDQQRITAMMNLDLKRIQ